MVLIAIVCSLSDQLEWVLIGVDAYHAASLGVAVDRWLKEEVRERREEGKQMWW